MKGECRPAATGPFRQHLHARLYWRLWLAVLISLLVFALAAGFLWRSFADFTPRAQQAEMIHLQAEQLLSESTTADAPQSVVERLGGRWHADIALFDRNGRVLAQAGHPLPPPAEADGGWRPGRRGPPAWGFALNNGMQLVVRPSPLPRHPTAPFWGPGGGFFAGLLLVALAVAVGSYPVVRRLTRRLERLQTAVESLGRGELSARVAVEGRDEVARLAASFNDAATRIEQLVAAHRLLLANASHELRTPLARLRVGLALLAEDPDPARRALIEQDISELDRLVDEILLTSRLDAQPQLDVVEEIDLLGLSAEVASRYPDVALDGWPVLIRGDRRLLTRLLGNLLDNAHRHGQAPVSVSVGEDGAWAELAVADGGEGISPADATRLFEPFQRLSGRSSGTGLGLSLVRGIARVHGGDVALAAATVGTRFVVRLPVARSND